MKPRKGLRFVHKFWLDEARSPMVFEVTKIARDIVYFRPVSGGKPHYCTLEQFARYVEQEA